MRALSRARRPLQSPSPKPAAPCRPGPLPPKLPKDSTTPTHHTLQCSIIIWAWQHRAHTSVTSVTVSNALSLTFHCSSYSYSHMYTSVPVWPSNSCTARPNRQRARSAARRVVRPCMHPQAKSPLLHHPRPAQDAPHASGARLRTQQPVLTLHPRLETAEHGPAQDVPTPCSWGPSAHTTAPDTAVLLHPTLGRHTTAQPKIHSSGSQCSQDVRNTSRVAWWGCGQDTRTRTHTRLVCMCAGLRVGDRGCVQILTLTRAHVVCWHSRAHAAAVSTTGACAPARIMPACETPAARSTKP